MSRKNNMVEPINANFHSAINSQVGVPLSVPSVLGKKTRSLLRYPGGKTRAVNTIIDMFPNTLDCLASPFFGGGSIELALVGRGIYVYGYDAFKPLVKFWQEAINSPNRLANQVASYHPISRNMFYDLQGKMKDDKIKDGDLAAVFYALNRSSFSGTTCSGGMSLSHPRFTESSIERIRDFDSKELLSIQQLSFEKSIPKHHKDFLYCDPPYANGGALYGQKGDCHVGFNHERLASILKARDGWILSYNDCSMIRDLYEGFTITEAEWTYGMNDSKKSSEILILSKDFKNHK